MKRWVVLASVLVLGSTACDDRPSAKKLKQATEQYAADVKADYQGRARAQFKDIIDHIDAVDHDVKSAHKNVQNEAHKRLTDLQEKRDAVRKKIDTVQSEGASAADAAKRGVDAALADLSNSYEDVKRSFDKP